MSGSVVPASSGTISPSSTWIPSTVKVALVSVFWSTTTVIKDSSASPLAAVTTILTVFSPVVRPVADVLATPLTKATETPFTLTVEVGSVGVTTTGTEVVPQSTFVLSALISSSWFTTITAVLSLFRTFSVLTYSVLIVESVWSVTTTVIVFEPSTKALEPVTVTEVLTSSDCVATTSTESTPSVLFKVETSALTEVAVSASTPLIVKVERVVEDAAA